MIQQIEDHKVSAPVQVTHTHPDLGDIRGWERGNDIIQFRGIPYADIPGRFRQSVLKTSLPNQPFDATNPGATCPHPPQEYWKYWEAALPTELPRLEPTRTDEFNCLNLSITIPAEVLRSDRKIPVFVFVHGGAFVGGSHAIQLHGREVFDPAGLVRHSMRIGKDMIGIGINYRVGPLGFLASKELSEFSRSHGEALGNYGLHDQRQALEWLHRFIAGFGGDPERITIQGTSAGGASCHFQTLFPERKFQRAILASGTCWGIGAVREETAQITYDRIWRATTPHNGETSLESVTRMDVDKLNTIVSYDVFNPLIDGVWVRQNALLPPDIASNPPTEIMVGAALREDDISELFLRDLKTWDLKSDADAWNFIKKTFASNGCVDSKDFPFDNTDLMQRYGLDKLVPVDMSNPELDLPTNVSSWASLIGHVCFNFPTYLLAERLCRSKDAGKVWLYHYEARNPYPASHSRDMAHHGVNDLLLFNVAPEKIPTEHREAWDSAVEQTQLSWILFVNGENPWEPISDAQNLGPMFTFRDGVQSSEAKVATEGLGSLLAEKWFAMRASCLK